MIIHPIKYKGGADNQRQMQRHADSWRQICAHPNPNHDHDHNHNQAY